MSSTTTKVTVEEVLESLTGFDEIAIEKHIGLDPYTDAERKPILLMRALVFVLVRREGATDAQAKQRVMEMPLKAVNETFEDDDEATPDEPDTDSGKGDSSPDSEPPS